MNVFVVNENQIRMKENGLQEKIFSKLDLIFI